jgi:hypothetical protein
MSVMTPFGTVEFKGQFLDYAWVVLILSISCLISQFASQNAEAFGVPTAAIPRLLIVERVSPFPILGFVAWAGANFEFHKHTGNISVLFGGDAGSEVQSGLDYGYWLAVISVVCLISVIGLRTAKIRQFVVASVGVTTIAVVIAFGISRSDATHIIGNHQAGPTPQVPQDNAVSPPVADETPFDATPYVAVISATGRAHTKNYEAERFSDSVDVNIKFQNLTDKTIVGIRGSVSVLDGFGKTVYSFGFRDDDKILPKSAAGDVSYNFDHNQFEDDDPYSKIYPLIEAETAKYQITVTNIAFSDGSILPAK